MISAAPTIHIIINIQIKKPILWQSLLIIHPSAIPRPVRILQRLNLVWYEQLVLYPAWYSCYTLGRGLFWTVPTICHRTIQCKFCTIRCILRSVWDEIVKLKKGLNINNGWSWHWTLQARVIGKYFNHWDTAAAANQKVNTLFLNCQVIAYHTNHLYIIICTVGYDNKLYGQQI